MDGWRSFTASVFFPFNRGTLYPSLLAFLYVLIASKCSSSELLCCVQPTITSHVVTPVNSDKKAMTVYDSVVISPTTPTGWSYLEIFFSFLGWVSELETALIACASVRCQCFRHQFVPHYWSLTSLSVKSEIARPFQYTIERKISESRGDDVSDVAVMSGCTCSCSLWSNCPSS